MHVGLALNAPPANLVVRQIQHTWVRGLLPAIDTPE